MLNTVVVKGERVTPSKIVCVGRNYVSHIEELGNEVADQMVVFMKPNSSISEVLQSNHIEPLHYEGELSLVFQGGCFTAAGFGLDLTKRQLQSTLKGKGLPWERAKSFDGSVIFSPFAEFDDRINALSVELDINEHRVQSAGVELMIYKPDEILAEISTFTALNDGDIVMTGTPEGVGVVKAGDVFTGRIKCGQRELVSATWVAC